MLNALAFFWFSFAFLWWWEVFVLLFSSVVSGDDPFMLDSVFARILYD